MNQQNRQRLKDAFTAQMPLPAHLEPHLRHALLLVLRNPGSLIRPEIAMEVALAYGLTVESAIGLAIGLEYFHTASLLFDDLPSMDDAMERRGLPCVHVEFGESVAMLAALALINRAYGLTWKAISSSDPENRACAMAFVESNLGVHGLLNGQSLDLQYASLTHTRSVTEEIAKGKTVSLIRLTLVLPAILGGAPAKELQLLERTALYWGLSYQIVDDLKDVLQSSAQSGKTVSRDSSMDRPNIALVLGVDPAAERLGRYIDFGDRMVQRLVAARPEMRFLESLRSELGAEASKLMESVCLQEVGGGV